MARNGNIIIKPISFAFCIILTFIGSLLRELVRVTEIYPDISVLLGAFETSPIVLAASIPSRLIW